MQRQPARPAQFGSQVITATPSEESTQAGSSSHTPEPPSVLRLRGAAPRNAPRVQWDEDVVDNEGLGRKKSKICCIYHKPKAFDESSSDDSSSSSDSSDSDNDSDGSAASGSRPEGDDQDHQLRADAQNSHQHEGHSCGHKHKRKGKKKLRKGGGSGSMVEIDKGKRNAYETQPGRD